MNITATNDFLQPGLIRGISAPSPFQNPSPNPFLYPSLSSRPNLAFVKAPCRLINLRPNRQSALQRTTWTQILHPINAINQVSPVNEGVV